MSVRVPCKLLHHPPHGSRMSSSLTFFSLPLFPDCQGGHRCPLPLLPPDPPRSNQPSRFTNATPPPRQRLPPSTVRSPSPVAVSTTCRSLHAALIRKRALTWPSLAALPHSDDNAAEHSRRLASSWNSQGSLESWTKCLTSPTLPNNFPFRLSAHVNC